MCDSTTDCLPYSETDFDRFSPDDCQPEVSSTTSLINNNNYNNNNDNADVQPQPVDFDGSGQFLTKAEKRRRRRATERYRRAHATRERLRVEAFNKAFKNLRALLPTLPPDKKLSKIEILRLAISYVAYLAHLLKICD
uniref:BHLH domain-containing protein n=1 Tax=Romanomermis culicivorax TaxID=13658 RepID=A0A915KAB2_ROMCU